MLAWHIGLRYLRRRRTAWLALAAVTFTVFVPVTVLGVMQGWIEISHAQIRAAETDLTVPAIVPMGHPIRQEIEALDTVKAVVPYIETEVAMVPKRNRLKTKGVRLDAIDWEQDTAIGRMKPESLHKRPGMDLSAEDIPVEDRGSGFLSKRAREDLAMDMTNALGALSGMPVPPPPRNKRWQPGLIVGRELAMLNPLELGVGAEVILALIDENGKMHRITCEVSDIIGTGVYEIDRYTAYIPLPAAQRLTQMDGRHPDQYGYRSIGGYRIILHDPDKHKEASEAIQKVFAKRFQYPNVLHWKQLRSGMVGMLQVYRNNIVIVMVLIIFLCTFVIFSVFSTLVVEKRYDIGVLLGMGATRGDIVMAFLLAGLVCCFIGGIIGWVLGWAVLAALNPVCQAFDISLFPQEVIYTPDTPISFDPTWPLVFLGIMAIVGLMAVAIPALRAGAIAPVATIRERH